MDSCFGQLPLHPALACRDLTQRNVWRAVVQNAHRFLMITGVRCPCEPPLDDGSRLLTRSRFVGGVHAVGVTAVTRVTRCALSGRNGPILNDISVARGGP